MKRLTPILLVILIAFMGYYIYNQNIIIQDLTSEKEQSELDAQDGVGINHISVEYEEIDPKGEDSKINHTVKLNNIEPYKKENIPGKSIREYRHTNANTVILHEYEMNDLNTDGYDNSDIIKRTDIWTVNNNEKSSLPLYSSTVLFRAWMSHIGDINGDSIDDIVISQQTSFQTIERQIFLAQEYDVTDGVYFQQGTPMMGCLHGCYITNDGQMIIDFDNSGDNVAITSYQRSDNLEAYSQLRSKSYDVDWGDGWRMLGEDDIKEILEKDGYNFNDLIKL